MGSSIMALTGGNEVLNIPLPEERSNEITARERVLDRAGQEAHAHANAFFNDPPPPPVEVMRLIDVLIPPPPPPPPQPIQDLIQVAGMVPAPPLQHAEAPPRANNELVVLNGKNF